MNTRTPVALAAMLAAGAAVTAQYVPNTGQPAPGQPDPTGSQEQRRAEGRSLAQPAPAGSLHRLSTLLGKDVETRDGRHAGEFANVVVNLPQGRATHVVINTDDSVGARDELVVLPVEAVEFGRGARPDSIAIAVDAERLRTAPAFLVAFPRDSFGDRESAQVEWRTSQTERDTNYPGATGNPRGLASGSPGTTASGLERNDRPAQQDERVRAYSTSIIRGSSLIGAHVRSPRSPADTDLGQIKDVMIETPSGAIPYLAMATGGMQSTADTLYVIPPQALHVQRGGDHPLLALDIDPGRIRQGPSFQGGDWPRSADAQPVRDALAFYDIADQPAVYGYTEPAAFDVQGVIGSWPEASRQAAREISQKYGQPDAVTPIMIVWTRTDPWLLTIVHRDAAPHNFPMAHGDVLEQRISYKVPADMFDDLARFDGSVVCDRTKGVVCVRCASEPMNVMTMNLVHEIVTGKRSVEEARRILAQAAAAFKQGESSEYTRGLMFEPMRNAADPDSPAARTDDRDHDRND
jgi:sporulation protein YlmC with PRC-barrel domain